MKAMDIIREEAAQDELNWENDKQMKDIKTAEEFKTKDELLGLRLVQLLNVEELAEITTLILETREYYHKAKVEGEKNRFKDYIGGHRNDYNIGYLNALQKLLNDL